MKPALLLALLTIGCANTSTYTAISAAALAGKVAVSEFKAWDAAHKRAIEKAHPECQAAMTPAVCYEDAIAPYIVKRMPVLAAAEATEAALSTAEVAAKKSSDGGVALAAKIADLTAKLLAVYAALRGDK